MRSLVLVEQYRSHLQSHFAAVFTEFDPRSCECAIRAEACEAYPLFACFRADPQRFRSSPPPLVLQLFWILGSSFGPVVSAAVKSMWVHVAKNDTRYVSMVTNNGLYRRLNCLKVGLLRTRS
jgi:hypothetical protein